MERQLIINKAICNECKDEIQSRHRHDFVVCSCGEVSVDGGIDYLRRLGSNFTETSLYTDDSFTELRKFIERGGRGINGDEPLKYVLLKDLNDNWLKNLIEYEEENRPDNAYLKFYKMELWYRASNKITIKEE